MKKFAFGMMIIALTSLISACGTKPSDETSSNKSETPVSSVVSSKESSSVSKAPKKTVNNISISLGNEGEKAYITVRGTQSNYTADEFKWAWGLKDQDSNSFADGKEKPSEEDFKKISFNENNEFTVKYCLTDIQTIKAGVLYRIYGGTPETYGDIEFASNMFGANDATRKYYLRQDQSNSLTFDSVQPFEYTLASVVKVDTADLPEGVTQAGAYLKFGAVNSKKVSLDTINGWNNQGKIAGDFQRVIGDGYSLHAHADTERFWKLEDDKVFFYSYCGFIAEREGWMVHFDLVSGNQNAGLQTTNTFNGSTPYVIDGATYKIFSDRNKSGEENYWGCLGVYREAAA